MALHNGSDNRQNNDHESEEEEEGYGGHTMRRRNKWVKREYEEKREESRMAKLQCQTPPSHLLAK